MKKLELAASDGPSWKTLNETYGRNSGIYLVKLKNPSLDGYKSVSRLLCIDHEGLLYIGMSDAIISRFGGLRTGMYGACRFKSDSGRVYDNPAAHEIGMKIIRSSLLPILLQAS